MKLKNDKQEMKIKKKKFFYKTWYKDQQFSEENVCDKRYISFIQKLKTMNLKNCVVRII